MPFLWLVMLVYSSWSFEYEINSHQKLGFLHRKPRRGEFVVFNFFECRKVDHPPRQLRQLYNWGDLNFTPFFQSFMERSYCIFGFFVSLARQNFCYISFCVCCLFRAHLCHAHVYVIASKIHGNRNLRCLR